MTNGKNPRPSKNPEKKAEAYSAMDIEAMEKLSLEKANKAISAIENALAVWDLSKEKPPDLEPRINRLRQFHEALTSWERKMLKALDKKEDVSSRVRRLKEFTEICYMYI